MPTKIIWTDSFKNKYKKWVKKYPQFVQSFENAIKLFVQDNYYPSLKTHKLSGVLKGLWAFSISYDQRFVFEFKDANTIIAKDIGTHDEVY